MIELSKLVLSRISRFFSETIDRAPMNQLEKVRLQHFTVFVFTGVACMVGYAAHNLAAGDLLLTSLIFLTATSLIFGWLLMCHLPLGQLVYRINGVMFGGLVLYMLVLGGEDGSKSLWTFAFPLIVFFLMGKREGLLWSFAMLGLGLILLLIPFSGFTPYPYGNEFLTRFFTVYVMISAIAYWFEHFRDQHRRGREKDSERLREILVHSGDILYRRNLRDGSYDYISDAFTRLLGYSREETDKLAFVGAADLIHPDYREVHRQFVEKVLSAAGSGRNEPVVEYPMRHISGTYLWFSDRMALTWDSAGRPEYILGCNREITAQKEAEQAVQEAHGQMLAILDSIDAHVYVVDTSSHRILYMNGKMKKDFGDKEGEVCWQAFRSAASPCGHCTIPRLTAADGCAPALVEWEGYNPLTRRWYMNFDRMMKWLDKRSVKLQIAFDITRVKELEAKCYDSSRDASSVPEDGQHMPLPPTVPAGQGTGEAAQISPVGERGEKLFRTILLIDDDQMVREVGEMMLANLGFSVLPAENGRQAIELFLRHREEIDLVFCDQLMPEMDGWQTIAALRENNPTLPVIMVSGYDPDPGDRAGSGLAPLIFLKKPYSLETMQQVIGQVFFHGPATCHTG